MGFYGKIITGGNQNLQFDRIYPNKYIMNECAITDNIFIGRKVLIDYENKQNINYISENGTYYAINIKGTTTYYYIRKFNEDKEIVSTEKQASIQSDTVLAFESIYDLNQAFDKVYEPGLGRGYDNTVWQKTQIDNEVKYIHLASLNSVIPTIEIVQDPPTTVPLNPHYDEDNDNIKYTLHLQPTWGFRVAKAEGKWIETTKGNLDFVADTYYKKIIDSENNNIYYYQVLTQEQFNELNSNETIYKYCNSQGEIVSDQSTIWKKTEIGELIPGQTNKRVSTSYTNGEEVNGELIWTGNESKIPAAIFYNRAGFDKSKPSKIEMIDEISITPAKSGNKYNKLGTGKISDSDEQYEDVQELKINLPSVGNAISDVWDIIYGPKRTYFNNPVSDEPDDQNSLMSAMKKVGQATEKANTATTNANTATQKANIATTNANTATTNAKTATANANTATQNANNTITQIGNEWSQKQSSIQEQLVVLQGAVGGAQTTLNDVNSTLNQAQSKLNEIKNEYETFDPDNYMKKSDYVSPSIGKILKAYEAEYAECAEHLYYEDLEKGTLVMIQAKNVLTNDQFKITQIKIQFGDNLYNETDPDKIDLSTQGLFTSETNTSYEIYTRAGKYFPENWNYKYYLDIDPLTDAANRDELQRIFCSKLTSTNLELKLPGTSYTDKSIIINGTKYYKLELTSPSKPANLILTVFSWDPNGPLAYMNAISNAITQS